MTNDQKLLRYKCVCYRCYHIYKKDMFHLLNVSDILMCIECGDSALFFYTEEVSDNEILEFAASLHRLSFSKPLGLLRDKITKLDADIKSLSSNRLMSSDIADKYLDKWHYFTSRQNEAGTIKRIVFKHVVLDTFFAVVKIFDSKEVATLKFWITPNIDTTMSFWSTKTVYNDEKDIETAENMFLGFLAKILK